MRYWPQKPPLGVPINWGGPLARDLVACWLMNEDSGDKVYDLSGNGNIGYLLSDTKFAAGKFGSALSFAMTGDAVNCGNCGDRCFADGYPITISAWIKPTTLGDSNVGRIVDRGTSTLGPAFLVYPTNALAFIVDGATDLSRITSNSTIKLLVWQHVVVTWDGSVTAGNVHIYVNGVETTYQTTTNGNLLVDNAATNLYIGNNASSAGRGFNGLIDTLNIYNRALTVTEVQQLYTTPFRMFERPSIDLWTPTVDVASSKVGFMTLNTGYWGA